MNKAQQIIAEIADQTKIENRLTPETVTKELTAKLELYDIDGVQVDDVDIDNEGSVIVTFSDFEGDQLEVIFLVDDDEDTIIAIVNEIEEEEEAEEDGEVLIIELTQLNPSILKITGQADYVNMSELSWMNRETLTTILSVGDIDFKIGNKLAIEGTLPAETTPAQELKPIPYPFEAYSIYEDAEMHEATARVVRNGKAVRLPLVRRKRRRILSGAARAGIRKAVIKRRAKKHVTARKRKKSLKLRKNAGIKKRTGNTRGLKVAGGADRKR